MPRSWLRLIWLRPSALRRNTSIRPVGAAASGLVAWSTLGSSLASKRRIQLFERRCARSSSESSGNRASSSYTVQSSGTLA
jgi:hypothetical protein